MFNMNMKATTSKGRAALVKGWEKMGRKKEMHLQSPGNFLSE